MVIKAIDNLTGKYGKRVTFDIGEIEIVKILLLAQDRVENGGQPQQ